ncbi:Protein of unknown function [Gryllus bimaculatus]|nr:Protein of unknown function [Gryllus bimaculatus]
MWACVSFPWLSPDFTQDEALEPPITASWVPPALRNRSILARYDGELKGNEMAVLDAGNATLIAEVERANASAGVFAAEERFQPPVDERAVYAQTFCVDHTNDALVRHVLISGLITRHLNKCCPDGQRLTRRADACEDALDGGSGGEGLGDGGVDEGGGSESGGEGLGDGGGEEVGVTGNGGEELGEGEGGVEEASVTENRGKELGEGEGGSGLVEVGVRRKREGLTEGEGGRGGGSGHK